MVLVILSYDDGCVDVIRNVPDRDNYEEFLKGLGFKLSEISWICLADNSPLNTWNYNNGDVKKQETVWL